MTLTRPEADVISSLRIILTKFLFQLKGSTIVALYFQNLLVVLETSYFRRTSFERTCIKEEEILEEAQII